MSTPEQRAKWRAKAKLQYKRTNGLYQKRAHAKHYKRHPKINVQMTRAQAKELVDNIKLQLGKCVLHPFYNDNQDYLCTIDRLPAFCFDHIDRATKLATISQMLGCATKQEIVDEIDKCWLLCANCHQIKTYENRDYLSTEQIQIELKQPTLFDN